MADATDKMREALERLYRWIDASECQRVRYTGDHPMALAFAALAQQPAQGDDECSACVGTGSKQVRGFGVTAEFGACPGCKGTGQQPAQGEAVAEFRKNRSGSYLHWFINESSLPSSTMLYTALPAPSVPDARPIQSWMSDKTAYENHGWNACRAAMLASGGKASVTGLTVCARQAPNAQVQP